MRSEPEIVRINRIMDLINALYDYEDTSKIVSKALDNLAIDVEWLVERLYVSWSIAEAYQLELQSLDCD